MTNEELMRELQAELFGQVGGWVQFRRDFVVQLINALKVDKPKQELGDIQKGIIAYEVLLKLSELPENNLKRFTDMIITEDIKQALKETK